MGNGSMPKASVIIPWVGEESVHDCLKTLGKSRDFEIIVVDNRQQSEPVSFPTGRVVREAKVGVAAARNRGIRESRGEHILFIDADCLPEEGWVAEMLDRLAATGADAVQGPVRSRQTEKVARFIQAEFDQRQDRLQRHARIALVSTGNSGFKRRVLQEVGGFDDHLLRGEDTDLSFRLRMRGFDLRFVDRPAVWHTHPTRVRDLLRRKFWYGYWLLRIYLRNPRRITENTRTPRTQLVSIGIWLAWIPAVILWNWIGLLLVPLLAALPALPLVRRAGPMALILTPSGTLMNTLGLIMGLVGRGPLLGRIIHE